MYEYATEYLEKRIDLKPHFSKRCLFIDFDLFLNSTTRLSELKSIN